MSWYGKLPANWESRTIKSLFTVKKEIAGSEGYDVLSITQHGIKVKNTESNEGQMAKSYEKYQFVNIGDFAMNHMDLLTGWVDYSKHFGVTSPDYRVFTVHDNLQSKDYLLKVLQLCYSLRIFYAYGRGAASEGRWRLPRKEFMNFLIPLPPRDEQDQIVRYLDWKVSQINRLVSAKRRQIELLREQKKVTISEAVKQTESCQQCKIKNLAFFKSGTNLTAQEISDEGNYPVYGGNGVRGYYPEYTHDGEYLLVGRQGALCGNVHYVNMKFWPTEHAVTVKPYNIAYAKWLYYLLTDMNLNQYSNAAAQPGLSVEHVTNLPAYFPPLDTQQAIADRLDVQCANINDIVAKLLEEITLFTEYRTRLISDIVTGKLDVRGIAVPVYEVIEIAQKASEVVTESDGFIGDLR